ncbi:DUF4180 domain-containing protein [Neobittarella massiliensis]|uniref:DUF4180 domain-containing protein n=1 Tax=Neobittarella massiliensis (ex Bilen et al. 2018) TaxID=2041842 RepID=A0A8J6LXY9_9FIRM|nr:DUF4180 domain-containing protein [Neobittarella massiliensis]MBC3515058.1 DUF4180 domain-containing protein [Neobittarella massiliensis]
MQIQLQIENGRRIAVIEAAGREKVLTDVDSALDLMMQVRCQADADRIAIGKKAVHEDFFILSTGLAGAVLEKYIQYGVKLAIYGDYSRYTSKPLHDFISESNRGRNFFFVADCGAAVQQLAQAK